MKNLLFRYTSIFALALTTVLTAGCDDDENLPSRVTTFPVINLTGNDIVSVNQGSTFTDPGYESKEGPSTITTTVNGTVNTSTLGVYTITYTAVNSDGFTATRQRLVAVVEPGVASEDISGTYVRASTGGVTTVTKLGPGVYRTSNFGAVPASSPGSIFPAYFAQVTPTRLVFPDQNVAGSGPSRLTGDATILDASNRIIGFSYAIEGNAAFGTAVRRFDRQ